MFLIPLVRFLAFKRRARVVAIILLLGEIIPIYSYYVLKGLVYIVIIASLGRQLFFYAKCIKLNMHLSYNIKLVFNTEYAFLIYFYILRSL